MLKKSKKLFKLIAKKDSETVRAAENADNLQTYQKIIDSLIYFLSLGIDKEFIMNIFTFFDYYFKSFEQNEYDSISNKMMEIILKIKKRTLHMPSTEIDEPEKLKEEIINFVTNLTHFKPSIIKYKNMFAQLVSNTTTCFKNFITILTSKSSKAQLPISDNNSSQNDATLNSLPTGKRDADQLLDQSANPPPKMVKTNFVINKGDFLI